MSVGQHNDRRSCCPRDVKRERRVLTTEGSDIKLRIIGRLNLLVSQPFLYICVGQYTIVMVEITTQEYDYNISYIVYL